MTLYEGSRYTTDVLVVEVINPYTGLATRPAFIDIRYRFEETADDDKRFAPIDGQQWSNIGLKLLGDANAWWVIADMSGVVDPFEELLEFNALGSASRTLVSPSMSRFHLDILSGDIL